MYFNLNMLSLHNGLILTLNNKKMKINEKFNQEELIKEGYRMWSSKELASIIFRTVKSMSWGSHGVVRTNLCLSFKVQGHHFKGVVNIALNGADLFDVYYTKKNVIQDIQTDVYIEDLIDTIDRKVEYIKEYKEN